jgi:hypothetical protein
MQGFSAAWKDTSLTASRLKELDSRGIARLPSIFEVQRASNHTDLNRFSLSLWILRARFLCELFCFEGF